MLLRFACSNFKSIKDRQEILFTAANFPEHAESLIDAPTLNHKILPVMAVYGANASGKSNLLEALAFMKTAVIQSQTDWKSGQKIPCAPFRLDSSLQKVASTFECDFMVDGVRYQYGFSCSTEHIEEEWLFAYPKKRRQVWIQRGPGQTKWFGNAISERAGLLKEIVRSNSLAISAGFIVNEPKLIRVFDWFLVNIKLITPKSGPSFTFSQAAYSDNKKNIDKFISISDFGVSGFQVSSEVNDDDISMEVPKYLDRYISELPEEAIIKLKERISSRYRAKFIHQSVGGGGVIAFDPEDESMGTLRWAELAGPVLYVLECGLVLCVDELDNHLHPSLSAMLIKLFSNHRTNPKGAQLLFTTHNTGLLSADLLRRDQIWFTEKDTTGATHVYPLSDFDVSAKTNLEKLYLEGRVGATPYLDDLAALFEPKLGE